jgi:hypothetical protein
VRFSGWRRRDDERLYLWKMLIIEIAVGLGEDMVNGFDDSGIGVGIKAIGSRLSGNEVWVLDSYKSNKSIVSNKIVNSPS